MRICTILGARPQFIKAAALSRILREQHSEILIHTGQHYDHNMSDIFFDELDIPRPDYNLGISGGTHGQMTASMLPSIEELLIKEQPDMALVYGDTNSTLAGALAAVKLHIPICHVEAGVRMGTLINPEEVNRVLVDRIATLLFCCTSTAIDNLKGEGIVNGVHNTGDLMYDATLYYGNKLKRPQNKDIQDIDGKEIALPEEYYLLTCHREENTSDATLHSILHAMNRLGQPCIYPVHPRNTKRAVRLVHEYKLKNIWLTQPVGYLTSLYLVKHANKVVTDSGGLQREAWFFSVPCVTLLENPCWPETLAGNMNQLCAATEQAILSALAVVPDFSNQGAPFGDGRAAHKITAILTGYKENL